MEKKIILVTGSSSGIGKETAKTLAKEGHIVIVHGRDVEKTKRVFNEIKRETGNDSLDMITADLSLMSEVKILANKIKANYDHLDVLINNAGGQFGFEREETSEGREKSMAINTFAPFLLTYLLLDTLKKSDDPRVITVASESYRQGGRPILDDIELTENYSFTRAYGLSKLYVYWIMQHYARNANSMDYGNITFNTVEPGSVPTSLGRVSQEKHPIMATIVSILWRPMMQSVEKGAATSIYMATSDEVLGVNGKFYGNSKEKDINPKWQYEVGGQVVWDYCLKVCEQYLG